MVGMFHLSWACYGGHVPYFPDYSGHVPAVPGQTMAGIFQLSWADYDGHVPAVS